MKIQSAHTHIVKGTGLWMGVLLLAALAFSLAECVSYAEQTEQTEATEAGGVKKILFYRNPMNPSVTSSVPAKDEMGMDYIPVYEEDPVPGGSGRVTIPVAQAGLAGVASSEARKLHLYKTIRAVGRVAYDPQLFVAEEEFVSSLAVLDTMQQGGISEVRERARALAAAARNKLKLLGLRDEQIKKLAATRHIHTNLILPAEKMWIYGDVYEHELGWLHQGTAVTVTAVALPGEKFSGIIAAVNPVLDPLSRTVRFRVEVDDTALKLKPEMFVDITVQSPYTSAAGEHLVLAVPHEAVLDTGARKMVWIDNGDGEYEGRTVAIGPSAASLINGKELKFYPVLTGVREGERVVTRAHFLIDSQSTLTGGAGVVYSGALGAGDGAAPEQGGGMSAPLHQH